MKDLITISMFILAYCAGLVATLNIVFRHKIENVIVATRALVFCAAFMASGFLMMIDQSGWMVVVIMILFVFLVLFKDRSQQKA